MVEDGGEAALHWAGGDDPYQVPGGLPGVPHSEAAPTVSRAGSLTGLTTPGTQLVRLRLTGARLSSTEQGGKYRHLEQGGSDKDEGSLKYVLSLHGGHLYLCLKEPAKGTQRPLVGSFLYFRWFFKA